MGHVKISSIGANNLLQMDYMFRKGASPEPRDCLAKNNLDIIDTYDVHIRFVIGDH